MKAATKTPDETKALGRRLGSLLRGSDLVCLYGDLGSGKTTLTQGLARGAGYKGRVTSPTFGLARVYAGKGLRLYHVDLYRLGSTELGDVGLEDFLQDSRAACIVEWPKAGTAYWPADRLEIRITPGPAGHGRTLAFKALGPRSRELLRRLDRAGS